MSSRHRQARRCVKEKCLAASSSMPRSRTTVPRTGLPAELADYGSLSTDVIRWRTELATDLHWHLQSVIYDDFVVVFHDYEVQVFTGSKIFSSLTSMNALVVDMFPCMHDDI